MSFCVLAGILAARFVTDARPIGQFLRPVLAIGILALVIGAVSLLGRRYAALVAAVASAAVLYPPGRIALLILTVGVLVGLIARMTGQADLLSKTLVASAVAFLAGGVLRIGPLLSETRAANAATLTPDPQTHVVLLDAYPRADTLESLGIEITTFLEQLEARGFDHYPTAWSEHAFTRLTLTDMFGGGYDGPNRWHPSMGADLQRTWRLPPGFAHIATPSGSLSIPQARTLNPGGVSVFEINLIRESPFGLLPASGELAMDGLRSHLDRALELLGTTKEPKVFTHLLAPHTPFLYNRNGAAWPAPECWPDCHLFDIRLDLLGVTKQEAIERLAGYIQYLNQRLIESIDQILARNPEAVIVLFSDHGGRHDPFDGAEWHRIFFAARTPGADRPFGPAPVPADIFPTLGYKEF